MKATLLALSLLIACAQDSGTVIGVVTQVDGDLSKVRTFTLLVEGDSMTFTPAAGGNFDFPLTHLREHLRDGSPVRVSWERDGDRNVAVAVGDA